ncbi:whirlin [Trichonephila clavata]|uniref:Whirlin n=1 Tax=Trichonephila clavata TaxID=2740835 RepID=A0A8X6K7K9_TRICU|nr:whirlin [Trichonephila clavata]
MVRWHHKNAKEFLDAARAVLSRLEAIALTQRRRSPRSPRSPVPHTKVRRHRSLPDPHAIQARKKQQQLERLQQQRSASVRLPGHRTIPEGNGRFRIIVKKSKPLLGIAIEGGADTTQPLPRIISIHNAGAAFEAGGLKVGHIILEVDGIQMSKRPHHEVAQLIAQAFYATDKDQVEFLVIETSRNMESEVRRTSIMVFD